MRDRYQIEESASVFSFKPFHPYRSKLKWYGLAIVIFGVLSVFYYASMSKLFLIISATLFVMTVWFFLKEILLYIPLRYIFDRSTNEVYQSSLFLSKRKIMNLDEVVIYQSSEMGSWQYKIGKKKMQFVKSYAISEYFSIKKDNEQVVAYRSEILTKIEQMVTESSLTIPSNSGRSSFNH
ncbi:MAG: hypothetical protein LBE37_01080 [Sphingobacterium sp.]|jgi:hypothetical protein|nr:hypothetical protein [Sphingobacterium sp.]